MPTNLEDNYAKELHDGYFLCCKLALCAKRNSADETDLLWLQRLRYMSNGTITISKKIVNKPTSNPLYVCRL
jgi:hypothetical protein